MDHKTLQELDFTDVTDVSIFYRQSRRDFIKRLGGGIFIFVTFSDVLFGQDASRETGARGRLPTDFNAFLRIDENGRVTCFTGKIEMGQGPITSLPQMLAEDLEVPLESVDIVMGDTELCPWDGGTFGSQTTRGFGPALRAAAAEARSVLIELAAEAWKVPADQLVARDGVISDKSDPEKRISYGTLAKGKAIERHLTSRPRLKDPSQFKVIGTSHLHRDGLEKVTGRAKYTADVRLPGMLYARVLTPPAHGARLKSVNTDACKAIPGVQVVEERDLVAVLHELPDVAETALDRIEADYDPSTSVLDDQNIFDHLLKVATSSRVVNESGNLEEGKAGAAKKFESTYLNGYVAHAPIEPHAALAQIEGDKATVWASTQSPFALQGEVARAIGFQVQQVRIITPFVGGGFGGKSRNLQALWAARLAKAVGRPVQVNATRDEEFFYDTFRPAAVVKISSGIDASGKIAFWDYDVACAGERGSQHFYAIPHHRTVSRDAPRGSSAHLFATGPWRAPGNNTNTFARESQIDIMAASAGVDPVDFRLQNMTNPKYIGVLKAAAEKFGWTPAKGPSKRGYGVALGFDAGTYVAVMAEVAVDPAKHTVQVKRVVCVQDMGVVVNPQGAIIQAEGCVMMGLGYSLTEEVHFRNGKVLDANFDSYEIPMFSWTPKIETGFIESASPSQGGGEPAIIVMGAVIANAIYDACGARLFQIPATPERIKAALKQA